MVEEGSVSKAFGVVSLLPLATLFLFFFPPFFPRPVAEQQLRPTCLFKLTPSSRAGQGKSKQLERLIKKKKEKKKSF